MSTTTQNPFSTSEAPAMNMTAVLLGGYPMADIQEVEIFYNFTKL
jgi:hypothetical protein